MRANREVEETLTLVWSAECATPWSRYENLKGQIEIPIGESIGKLVIDDNNIDNFIWDKRTRNINRETRTPKMASEELINVEQIVIRLDEVKYGTALIKRDQRRCNIALVDDSKLRDMEADNNRQGDILSKIRIKVNDLFVTINENQPEDNDELVEVVIDLNEKLTTLLIDNQNVVNELNGKLNNMQETIDTKNKALDDLNASNSSKNELIKQLQDELKKLREQLEASQNQGSETSSQLEEKIAQNELLLARIAELEEKLAEADNTLLSVKDEINNLLNAIKKLENESEELKKTLDEKSNQLEHQEKDLDETRQTRDRYGNENEDLTERLQKTDADLTDLQEKLRKLEASFDELKEFGDEAAIRYANVQANYDKLKFQLDLLLQQKAVLETENDNLASSLVQMRDLFNETKNAIAEREKTNQELQAEIDRLKVKLSQLDKASGDGEVLRKGLEDELDKLKADLEKSKDEILVLSALIDELEKGKRANQAQIDEQQTKLSQKDEDIAEMENGFAKLSDKLDRASRETISEKEKREKTVAKMKSKLDEMENKNRQLLTTNISLTEEKDALSAEKETLNAEKKELEKDIVVVKEKIVASEGKHLTKTVTNIKEVLAGRTFGKKGKNGKQLTVYDLYAMIEDLEEKLKQLEMDKNNEINKLAREVGTLTGTLNSKNVEADALRENKLKLELQLQNYIDANANLLDEIEKLKRDLAKLNAELKDTLAEFEEKERDLQKLNDDLSQMKNDQGDANQENDDLKRKLKELQDELEEVNDNLDDIENAIIVKAPDAFGGGRDEAAPPRLKNIRNFIANKINKEFDDKKCQTEEGGISLNSGELCFEHDHFDFIREDEKVLIPIKRLNGTEGHASCLWLITVLEGTMDLFSVANGFVYFEDGEDQARVSSAIV